MAVLQITEDNFEAEVLQSDRPVFLDFWADWCGPCQMVSPVVEELSEEVPEVKFGKVNVDAQPELAQKFRVMSIPTMVLLKEGKIVETTVGAQPKEDLLRFIRA